jgi:hypothetical protein
MPIDGNSTESKLKSDVSYLKEAMTKNKVGSSSTNNQNYPTILTTGDKG